MPVDRPLILLIEDDSRLAGMVRDYLGESGFDVTVAGFELRPGLR